MIFTVVDAMNVTDFAINTDQAVQVKTQRIEGRWFVVARRGDGTEMRLPCEGWNDAQAQCSAIMRSVREYGP